MKSAPAADSPPALGTVTIGQSGQEALGTRLIIVRAN